MLMVEKTVPASDVSTGAGSFIYDAIVDSLSSGKTLYAAGGILEFNAGDLQSASNMLQPHGLIGDNSEGYSADTDIDETLSPANYTPRADDASQNVTPSVILDSTSVDGSHESVFNMVSFPKISAGVSLTDKGDFSRVEPDTVVGSPSAGQFDTAITRHTQTHTRYSIS